LLAIAELSVDLIDCLLTVLPDYFEIISIQTLPFAVHPFLVAVEPSSRRLPHVRVGLEVFGKTEKLLVISGIFADKSFITVVLASKVNALLNVTVNTVDGGSGIGVLVDILEFFELKDRLLQVVDIFEELLLLRLHVFDHLLLQLFEDLSLTLHDAHNALGAAE